MKIAVASGKGGTGKTFVSTNLANVASKAVRVALYDLDVDEPNCHLFFNRDHEAVETVKTMIPVVDGEKCLHCGTCSDVCEFHAIVSLPTDVLVFPELCHSCYGCLEMCPEEAITEGFKDIGTITVSEHRSMTLVTGKLRIGQPATTALVRATKDEADTNVDVTFYDSPPGTSCPVIEVVKDVDYVILVGEPTRFGLHDLDLMVQTLKQLDRHFGVIINKAAEQNHLLEDYCREQEIDVIVRIPERSDIAVAYARGELVTETMPELEELFGRTFKRLRQITVGSAHE
ncbi:MAG: ATP-binding protein [Candidatus Latescibacterota bacterium]|nr:MAG: ATP-binding protein [Candidatus Latescibacterota bacterium]